MKVLKCLKCGSTELTVNNDKPLFLDDIVIVFATCVKCKAVNQVEYSDPHITQYFNE